MITNGTVEYSRRVRTGDFEHKDAKVSLSFAFDPADDADAALKRIGQLAVARAHEMVGDAVPAGDAVSPPVAAVSMPAVTLAAVVPTTQPAATPEPMASPTAMASPSTMAAAPSTIAAPVVMPPVSPASVPASPVEGPKEITDADLVHAASSKNAKLLSQYASDTEGRAQIPNKIHAVVGQFVTPPAGVRQIPQERRRAFLDALEALS